MSVPEVTVATSRLDGVAVSLALDGVARIDAWDAPPIPEGAAWVDAARLLGAALPLEGRRVLGLAGRAPLFVVLGEAVAVRRVPLTAVHPLPAILSQAGRRFACAGLLREDEGFSFLLDADALRAVAGPR